MSTKKGTRWPASSRARAARRPDEHPFDAARVTDDPVKIAGIRYSLAFDALLEIRPWAKEERQLGRRVLDIAARELEAMIAEERRRRPPPLPRARTVRSPSVSALANGLLGGLLAGG